MKNNIQKKIIIVMFVVGLFLVFLGNIFERPLKNNLSGAISGLHNKNSHNQMAVWLIREGWKKMRSGRFNSAFDISILAAFFDPDAGAEELKDAINNSNAKMMKEISLEIEDAKKIGYENRVRKLEGVKNYVKNIEAKVEK
mgnify:CR=1 FL=1